MAITANVYTPNDYNPYYARNEYQSLHLVGDGTEVMVQFGGGDLQRVDVGVAGTLAKFYDTDSPGGTPTLTDATTLIKTVDTSVTGTRATSPVSFQKGLVVITTGSSGDITISFRGRPTKSNRTFGAAFTTSSTP